MAWIPSTPAQPAGATGLCHRGDIFGWHVVGWFGSPQHSQLTFINILNHLYAWIRLVFILKLC